MQFDESQIVSSFHAWAASTKPAHKTIRRLSNAFLNRERVYVAVDIEGGAAKMMKLGYLHYGPYSSELAAEVDSLVQGNLLKQDGGTTGYDPYVYGVNETASKLLRELTSAHAPPWKTMASLLNEKDPNLLEAMSTILYLRQNGFSGPNLQDRFYSLKPNLKSLFKPAMQNLDRLGTAEWEFARCPFANQARLDNSSTTAGPQ